MITATEKLEAIRRELTFRRRVYPRQVKQEKMTQQLADRQIALFEAIEADYQSAVDVLRAASQLPF
jgi:hypothetical protein